MTTNDLDIELYGFTVSAGDITVYCGGTGVSWGYKCDHKVCEKRSFIGWDGAQDVAGGAAYHLIWHAEGMHECKHCGTTLIGDEVKAGECRPGECSERDGGW